MAFEQAYRLGIKPVTTEIIESVLAIGLDDLEPSLIRHGAAPEWGQSVLRTGRVAPHAKSLAELLNVRTTEVRSFLHGQLPPGRTQDMRDQMLRIGIPL